ncbi:MAG: hypothetical protein WCD31_04670 [Gillisia sp.]
MKASIEAGVPNKNLATIVINSSNRKTIKWKEKGEFSYRGNMYDVVKAKQLSPNSRVYYCLKDSRETFLLALLDKTLKKNDKNKNSPNTPLQASFKIMPASLKYVKLKEIQLKERAIKNNFKYVCFYNSLSPDILAPPPKFTS